ncbi:MAG: hypothetical protein EAZ76_11865 [Nostocales cyanobacterium]|nr:MAG: hypothetical protein EAZ87_18855 [Nostocales cyanobacterium]TAF13389.1 MAG: hypothetical protein EAZ76_11865 [Nostocales cyanobacterium]
MSDIHNNSLFTDITAEEEVSVQGGKFWFALAAGGAAFSNWLRQPGNGFFINADGRRRTADDVYMGSGWNPSGDPNGWRWGIRDGGNWILGGYGTRGQWVVDRIRQIIRR